jgi:hypothetical protein
MMRLEEEGYSIREITEEMRISPATVHRILKSHRAGSKNWSCLETSRGLLAVRKRRIDITGEIVISDRRRRQ